MLSFVLSILLRGSLRADSGHLDVCVPVLLDTVELVLNILLTQDSKKS